MNEEPLTHRPPAPGGESSKSGNGIASATTWRAALEADRAARAERLRLPSGTTILAVKPEPLEWIMSGRLPQRLLGAALGNGGLAEGASEGSISREEILDLARFATQLVEASIVEPAIGDAPGEIALEEIPVEDRAFIFEWACRALGEGELANPRRDKQSDRAGGASGKQEDLSIPQDGMERFRAK